MLSHLIRQEDAPLGYRPEVYGPWPSGGVWIVKMRVASFWKSTRNPANFHTVTYIFSNHRDPDLNPLLLGEGLEQLMGSHCSGCKAGLRTAASCLHRVAGIILLCGAKCFDTAKVPEPVYLDTARYILYLYFLSQSSPRPDSQIPLNCGTPAAFPGGDRDMLYRLPPRPPRAFTDSRIHTLGDLLSGYDGGSRGAALPHGHDQQLFDATYSSANLQNIDLGQLPGHNRQPRQRQQRQNNQNERSHRPPILSNGPNLCFAAASFHLLEQVKVGTYCFR